MKDLTIIITNYNTSSLLKNCIDSIYKFTKDLDFEIIVVDNASTDDSVEVANKIASKRDNLALIKSKKNLGFGMANNLGIEKAKGELVLLLNSDTLLENNLLKDMQNWMNENREVGIVGSALLNKDGSFQGSGGYFPTLFKVFSWMFFLDDIPLLDKMIKPFHPLHKESFFYKGTSNFGKETERDWITGAFMLIRKQVFNEVGVFDKEYFMYTEEVDLCFRAKKKGWRIKYLPQWHVIHLGGASSTSEFALLSEFKGIKTFYKKRMPGWQYPLLRIILKTGIILRVFVFGLVKGLKVSKIYAKAYQII